MDVTLGSYGSLARHDASILSALSARISESPLGGAGPRFYKDSTPVMYVVMGAIAKSLVAQKISAKCTIVVRLRTQASKNMYFFTPPPKRECTVALPYRYGYR